MTDVSNENIEEIGEDAARRIAPEAAGAMRDAIAAVGGREVFFAGSLGTENKVVRVRVCARGTEGAVPAVVEGLRTREVVIHNHPSGLIAPSGADLELSSLFSFEGHGVYIVDNAVERVYVMVEPAADEVKQLLDPRELAQLLESGGPLAKKLTGFEPRPQQAAMAGAVARAFNDEGIAVVEAPTGVGKTVAYLLPAILWAVRNRERVVVSTRTINLQEQIIHKDVPFLQQALGLKFSAVLVKGRQNYLCWRKFNRARSEASLFEDDESQEALRAIAEWTEVTEDGTLSDLPFVPRRELWSQINSESDTCRVANCPNPKKCFIGRARRDIAKADLLVVNHHMLFSDLAIKREIGNFSALAVLPSFRRIIFDEAHSIEDSATEYFGMEAARQGALATLGRFVRNERGHERGLLPFLKLKLIKQPLSSSLEEVDRALAVIDSQLLPQLTSLRSALTTAFDALRSLVAERCQDTGTNISWRLTQERLADPDLREIHEVYVVPAVKELTECARFVKMLLDRVKALEPPKDHVGEPPFLTEIMQLEGYGARLERLGASLAEGTSEELQANTVRWVEIDAKDVRRVRVVRCPLEVGKDLAEWVYGNLKTVAMTSATLSVRGKFDYLSRRIGLDRTTDKPVKTLALPTPFDYTAQAALAIPTDLPAPNDPAFLEASNEAVYEVLRITRGHAFVLYTSFYALGHAFRALEDPLRREGITALRQGDASRHALLDQFRADASSVLFATDSFWEGVDVPGDALQCVILPRLPFRVPTEPVQQARVEAIEAAGCNAFMEYTVPQAVIRFRQGFGRLIRRRSDRGAVVVLDARIVQKHYGRAFLESLPPAARHIGPKAGVWAELARFFGKGERGKPE